MPIEQHVWRPGSRYQHLDAGVIAAELAELESATEGTLTPEGVVEYARKDESLHLHGAFDWNDSSAAEEHRKSQARKLLRDLQVVIVGDPRPRPVKVSVVVPAKPAVGGVPEHRAYGTRAYVNLDAALQDPVLRRQVLSDALRELEIFRKKYDRLRELAPVIRAIVEVEAGLRK